MRRDLMKRKLLIGCIIASISILSLTGCTSEKPVVSEELPLADPLASTSPKLSEDAAKAMQAEKSIEGIKSITLTDIEGNTVDRTFTEAEMKEIETAFNESFIMDTAYIEMITGYTMTIALEDGRSVFIHSYGEENYIVASIEGGQSYHLGCELIGKILLEGNTQE